MSNLIIAMSIGYEYETIKYFINSLNRTTFTNTLIIISDKEIKINGLNFNLIYEIVDFSKIPLKLNSPINWRHYLYKSIVDKYDKVEKIALMDIRDVIFQSNPFDIFNEDLLQCAMEDNSIDNCPRLL